MTEFSTSKAGQRTLEKKIDVHVRKGTLMLTLNLLANKNIPIGIEFSSVEMNEPKLDIDVNQAPLVEVLNLIVRQDRLTFGNYETE